jgi:HlyD family secretion protein
MSLLPSDATYTPLVISPEVGASAVRRRRLLWALAVVVVITTCIAVFASGRSAPPRYEAASVERRTIVQEVEVTGQLDVRRRVEVPAPLPGRLLKVLAREGEPVTEGQPLALLDDRALAIAARGARASLEATNGRVAAARVALAAAAKTLERTERLRKRELASDSDVGNATAEQSKAQAALAAAIAERAQAQESLRSAKLSASLSSITSPMSGIVLQEPEVSGAAVSPEREPLFVIGSALDALRVVADVAESDVSTLRPGQLARFTVPAHPGRFFAARVERVGISARRSAVAVRYPVELLAENRSGELLPGMTATVTIAVARKENVLATRDAALRFRPEGTPEGSPRASVWRITPHGLEQVRVTAGLSDGAFTELLPEIPGSLAVGTGLALGLQADDAPKTSGPGIRLGNR